MSRFLLALAALFFTAPFAAAQNALPQRTIHYQALAERVVAQLQLEPGEKVISLAMPGHMNEFIPYIRYAVMKAGGVDLGVIEILKTPFPEDWDAKLLRGGLNASQEAYVKLLEDVDAAIMLPGANPAHPAYKAMQRLLATKKGPRRTIHFHWTDPYSQGGADFGLTGVSLLPGHPPPPMQAIDIMYQDAVLNTDLKALGAHQRRFVEAMKPAVVRVTSPLGTDISFRVQAGPPVIIQDGDASARHAREATTLVEREVEIPAGAIRVVPDDASVNGVIAYGTSRWAARTAENAKVFFTKGKVAKMTAAKGVELMHEELDPLPASVKYFGGIALGFNPQLATPERYPWIAYYGYGAGVVRFGIGNNEEIGGSIGGSPYSRRDLFVDCTVALDGVVWVKDGKFVK